MQRKQMKLENRILDKTIEQGFNEFIRRCKVKNLRESTIKTYSDFMKYYIFKLLDKDYLIKDIDENTWEELIIYLKENTKCTPSAINSNLKQFRTILNFFIKCEYLEPMNFELLEVDKEIIETYTEEELRVLLKKPNVKNCTFCEYREWAIINFLLGTGCRVTTLINIKVKDIDFNNNLITYTHTKNRKKHIVPLSETLKGVLIEYLSYRQPKDDDDYLFATVFNEKLNRSSVNGNIAKYNKDRGVETKGIHKFRHTFAKMWILNDGNIFKLKNILQHSTMGMVNNYVNLFTSDISEGFSEFNPLDNLQGKKRYIKMRK